MSEKRKHVCYGKTEGPDSKPDIDNCGNCVSVKLVRIENDAKLLCWIKGNLKTDINFKCNNQNTKKRIKQSISSKSKIKLASSEKLYEQTSLSKSGKVIKKRISNKQPGLTSLKPKCRTVKGLRKNEKSRTKRTVNKKSNSVPPFVVVSSKSTFSTCDENNRQHDLSVKFDENRLDIGENLRKGVKLDGVSNKQSSSSHSGVHMTNEVAPSISSLSFDFEKSFDSVKLDGHKVVCKSGFLMDSSTLVASSSKCGSQRVNDKCAEISTGLETSPKCMSIPSARVSKVKSPSVDSNKSSTENVRLDSSDSFLERCGSIEPSSLCCHKEYENNNVCTRVVSTSINNNDSEDSETTHIPTIYDLMQKISVLLPSWNLHILTDSNTFCIAQVVRNKYGIPYLSKCIELDTDFNAKVYVYEKHCKKFDGIYDNEDTVAQLISEVDSYL